MVGERRKQYAEYDRQRPFETRRKQDCEQLRLVADFGERDDGGRGEQGFHDNSGAGRLRDSNRHQTRRPARTKVDAIGLAQAVSRFHRTTTSRPSMLTRWPVPKDGWLLPR